MFPSSNSYNPFPFPGTSLTGDKNSAGSSQDDPAPPFWHFPAPFIDDDDDGLLMSHLLSQAQNQIFASTSNVAATDSLNKAASPIKETKKKKRNGSNGPKQGIPRKRTGKKDRHSKIYTAHGPRDRRMRLSLQIARKFFDLQDMLGFDKASKTIEWLFSKSKAAIKELTDNLAGVGVKNMSCSGGGKSVSSTSESEVVSAAKECENNMGGRRGVVIARHESMKSTNKETQEIKSRKVSFNPVARESRDKARARARERTREKMKMRMRMKVLEKPENCSDESSNPNELERLRSSRPNFLGPSTQPNSVIEEEEETQHQQQNTGHLLEHQIDSISFIEKFLGITRTPRSPSPSRFPSPSMFNYPLNIAGSSGEKSEENCPIILLGNWGMNNDRMRYGYHAMTSIRESTGNAQEQNTNPSLVFMTDTNANTQHGNPISNLLVNSISNTHEGSPTPTPSSILMPTSKIGLQSQSHSHNNYHGNASKYRNFY